MSLVLLHALRERGVEGRLGRVFVFQGLFNFGFMSVLNLVTASFYLQENVVLHGHGLPYSESLILSDILACRLILDLRWSLTPTESTELHEQSRLVREGLRGCTSGRRRGIRGTAEVTSRAVI
ncbi:hypothetical protein BV22DRAFT_706280 [Leucogyrophana mollusca]|uniref:Uncharacterized protein n=1 Tax=Leucogyrophana mollusca TaxID=85980 RepID=A0ACB8B8X3_9AGAM|nr:hypothetical protein BV22DRAFT_706280 [Leucogyrophana mollusca]